MDSVFLNSFQNVTSAHYRWPVLLAILLHVLFFGLLFSHFSLNQATSYTQTPAIQANLVSSSALSAMMAKSTPAPVKTPPQPQTHATPTPPPPPPPKTKAPSPIKPIPITEKQPAPAVKITPTRQKPVNKEPAITKSMPQKTLQQKSLEESLLDTELKTDKPITKAKKTNNALEQQLMAEQLQAETKGSQTASSKPNQAAAGAIDQYKALILQQIQQNWIVPENVANLSCILQVQLAPGGMVLHVSVVKSSGNEALDRSALAAVNKASPLPVPKDSATFSAFRNFTLTVKPQGE